MKSESPSPGGSPERKPSLGEKLDQYYLNRQEAGETSAIPISMLNALDGLAGDDTAYNLKREQRSPEKGELTAHLRRVAAYAYLLALKCGLDEQEAKLLKQVCPMHDIGKWMIPSHILQKPAALDKDEWAIMKTHASAGYEILKDSKLGVLQLGAMVAMQHQEKFDGSGYPLGLRGGEIHLYSRITTVVDVFDALGSARAYKDPWPVDAIVEYFRRNRGTHFDPALVDLLLGNLDEFLAIRKGLEQEAGGAA